jgi:hypothetical protein
MGKLVLVNDLRRHIPFTVDRHDFHFQVTRAGSLENGLGVDHLFEFGR